MVVNNPPLKMCFISRDARYSSTAARVVTQIGPSRFALSLPRLA
jgi:hypothetical protein